jgi:hypothetical protein
VYIIIRILQKDINEQIYREVELTPLTANISIGSEHKDILIEPIIINHDYHKYQFTDDMEIYIEPENIELLARILEKCEYSLRPHVHKMLVEQEAKRQQRESFGESWFSRLHRASLFDLWNIWREIRAKRRLDNVMNNLGIGDIYIEKIFRKQK